MSRRKIKTRRARRVGVAVSEDQRIAEPEMGAEIVAAEINVGNVEQPRAARLTDEDRAAIVNLYVTTSTPLKEIGQTYGIRDTYVFYLLKQAHISWRRGDGTQAPTLEEHSNGVVPEVVHDLPEDNVKALERMLKLPEQPSKPEPVRAPVLPEPMEEGGAASPLGPDEQTWHIEYRGSMLVRAASIDQAIERARVDGHVREIVGIVLRTR